MILFGEILLIDSLFSEIVAEFHVDSQLTNINLNVKMFIGSKQ